MTWVLEDPGADKVAVIKVIREATGWTLQQAFDAVQSTPSELPIDDEAAARLSALGATVSPRA